MTQSRFSLLVGHHIKTYVQNLNIIGSFVNNLSRLQAWPVSQMIFFHQIRLLRKFHYFKNIFSMKNELCMCNISMKGNMSPTRHGGIQRIRLHNLINHNTNLSGSW